MKTILWQYEKSIDKNKKMAWLLTGLFSPCHCETCYQEFSRKNKLFYNYAIGSSNYFLYIRINPTNDQWFYSIYNGCPKKDGSIVISGFEEVFNNLDDVDRELFIYNINLFR